MVVAVTFKAVINPPEQLVRAISQITPENPFYTIEYVNVRKRSGAEPCCITLESDTVPVTGCPGFLTRGRFNSRLEITSLPQIPEHKIFWNGLFDFCRHNGVSVLSIQTFASTEPSIGEERKRTSLKRRSEYRLDLTQPDLWEAMNRRHHRLIKRAVKRGLVFRRSNESTFRSTHVDLANLSLDRRRGRGESIDSKIDIADVNSFIECGAGEIIQAVIGDDVHASMLLAKSRKGGYAQSSGTSAFGRETGASHFLFYEAAKLLKAEGAEVFNLGGADEHSTGLQEFKLGLGSTRIDLESAEFYTGSILKRFATGAISLLKGVTLPI